MADTKSKKPLNVRCAEALGWRDVRHAKSGWIGVAPGVLICSEPISPYGDDTPAGWACTGPLIERFGLLMDASCGELSVWDEEHGFEVLLPDSTPRVTAYAEWVARCGAEAIKREVKRG